MAQDKEAGRTRQARSNQHPNQTRQGQARQPGHEPQGQRVPLETAEDLQLIKQAVLLPLLLDVLERDMRSLLAAEMKLGDVYAAWLDRIQLQVVADVAKVRQDMRRRGLKVYEERRTALGVQARYLCRGYHSRFAMLWRVVRAELSRALAQYLHSELEGRACWDKESNSSSNSKG